MIHSGELRSGKGSHDENFPVASRLIKRQHRPVILAFYEFVRVADDIADHPQLTSAEKIDRLDRLESSLVGSGGDEPEGLKLRAVLNERGLLPRHAQDLLSAFRQDATKLRYANWDELIDYCSRSAMPVGRFVLDVHCEDIKTWPASDALCAALQIINHLQDCGKDYRTLDRVYIPLDAMERHGVKLADLGADRASPALTNCIRDLAARTRDLLHEAAPFSMLIDDLRLALEVAVIHKLAVDLVGRLMRRDPLRERVHHNGAEAAGLAAAAIVAALPRRALRRSASAA